MSDSGLPGRYGDGNGLYLAEVPTGSRNWIPRIVLCGRCRDIGLGGFPLVSLGEARKLAFANRKVARRGGDPVSEKRRSASVVTFAVAAERVWKDKNLGWRHPRHAQDWMSSLRRHALRVLGHMPVSDISSAEMLDALRRIWHVRPATARRVRQRISAMMDWAIAMQFHTDNPCDRHGHVLGPHQDQVQHMQALPHREEAAAIRATWSSGATEAVKPAFEFLVLTAARSGEVRSARWAEIDQKARVWTIPATHMKAKREHRVPLSGRTAEILEAARKLGNGRGRLVLPSRGDKPISIAWLPRMLHSLKVAAVLHGFRSSFRDLAAEETNHPREVVEAALAHVVANQTEAAFARSDLFELRRRLTNESAKYLSGGHRSDARSSIGLDRS